MPGENVSSAGNSISDYGNSSCQLPPRDEDKILYDLSNGKDPEVIASEEFKDGILLRIPIWCFATIAIYLAVTLSLDVHRDWNSRGGAKYSKMLKVARLFATTFTAAALTYAGISVFYEQYDSVDCNWFEKAENALYWINISVIYTVLWLRQRAIFSRPNLKHLTNRCTTILSYMTIFFVIALPVVNSLLFSTRPEFCHHPILKICIMVDLTVWSEFQWGLEYIVPALLPLTLLLLLSWPLLQHHRRAVRTSTSQRSVISALRRIFIVTLICLCTDLWAITCNGIFHPTIAFVMRQLSVFSNLICLIVSFADWRSMIWPRKVVDETPVHWGESTFTPSSLYENTPAVEMNSSVGSPVYYRNCFSPDTCSTSLPAHRT